MAKSKERTTEEELPPLSAPSSSLSSAAESSGSKSSDEDLLTSSTGSSNGDRESSPKESLLCCVLDKGRRCDNSAGRAKLKGKVQHPDLKHDDSVSHKHVCTFHEALIKDLTGKGKKTQNQPRKRKRTQDDDEQPKVDFSTLSTTSLRKYKKFFKITHRGGVEKDQLEETVAKHFKTIAVDEEEVLTNFLKMTGRLL
ncbi:histone deacetylase complex subunit SAP30 homolog [Babylonia areolata]|uniref:histone deacetylase complex subunit SAP30 homolog n=1 Tax=Babylonia areolata TaxID=304850 RepID=UPI003FD4620E